MGDTSHAPLKQKFTKPYSKLKVQSVHEYLYSKNDITVGYHGGIENTDTWHTFKTNMDFYKTCVTKNSFRPTHWRKENEHVCREEKLKVKKEMTHSKTPQYTKEQMCLVTNFQKRLLLYAHDYASLDIANHTQTEEIIFKLPKCDGTKNVEVDTYGWAAKHPIPSVSLSLSIKKRLADAVQY